VIAIPTTYYEFSAAQMQQHGIRMAIYANHGLRAATRAMAETYAEILGSGSSTSVEYRISSLKELFELQGVDEWLRFDQP
jgi:phosphoenolpyruvate phosphomutase